MSNVFRESSHSTTLIDDRKVVVESPQRTPVIATVDVLIVGGGPAGIGAAIAAGRTGAKTLLIERHGFLGGMWTAGLVNPFFDFEQKGWIVAELVDCFQAHSLWHEGVFKSFDTEMAVHLLDEMLAEANVEVWYHTFMSSPILDGNTLQGVIVESKARREAILAKIVIDCSGDADVAARSGVPYELGRAEDGFMQPMTLMFEIEGLSDDFSQSTAPELYEKMCTAIEEYHLGVELPFGRSDYAPWIIRTPTPGHALVQATHIYRLNGIDPRDVSHGLVTARKQVRDIMRVLRHIPGIESIRLTRTAPTMGIRETRRIHGQYCLSLDDMTAGRHFPDAITFCSFGVDIHEPAPDSGISSGHGVPIRPYEIPYRCLVPLDVENLLVAGRCISGSHEAHASYRVTGVCMAMGQAAGMAAAASVAQGIAPSAYPGEQLHLQLKEKGVGFLSDIAVH